MGVLHPISALPAPAVRLLPAEGSPIPITARAQPIRAAAAVPRATGAGAYFPIATADALGPRRCNAGEIRVD
jgi:hypothetical protein